MLLAPGHPDFRHKTSKEDLWPKRLCKPGWVNLQLTMWDAGMRAPLGSRIIDKILDPKASPRVAWSEADFKAGDQFSGRPPASSIGKARGEEYYTGEQNAFSGYCSQPLRRVMQTFHAASSRLVAGGGQLEKLSGILPKDLVVSTTKLIEDGQLAEAVESLNLLVETGFDIDVSLFYQALKRCMAEKNLALGRRVHTLAVRGGYESNLFWANNLICMYASYGRLDEATKVFMNVTAPDCYMWSSIILAHARCGQPRKAIMLYQRMRGSDVRPDNHIFVAVLKACATAADLDSGKEVHADILGTEVKPNMFVGNSLVHMYAKCGSLEDARRVFDLLPRKNVVTWNSIIAGYVQHGLGAEAITLYAGMQQEGMTPANHVTFACLLQACASEGALHEGHRLHAQIKERGLEVHVVVGSCLVEMYVKCGRLGDARQVFDTLPERNVVTWTSMIAGYAQHGLGHEALTLYGRMQQDPLTLPNHVTFVCLLQACASIQVLEQGKQLHAQISERGLESDIVIGNCLVDMYAKCGSLEDAHKVFTGLVKKDVVSWTAMIAGYAKHGRGQEALNLYSSMQREGLVLADGVTFVSLLQVCATVGALHQGKLLHEEVKKRGLEADVIVGNCLVDMYGKCGSLEDARRVFDKLPTRDVVTWNALINGCAQHCDGEMAIRWFREMCQQDVKPNDTTFICLLVACSHAGLVHEGQHYFNMMVFDHGILPTNYHYNCLVDLLGRSGRLDEAEKLLHTVQLENDVVGWTSLLSACKSHGHIELGRRCFDHLIRLEPDNASSYVLLASMYATAGRWKDVDRIESLRKFAGAEKKPGKACIEVKNKVHEFTVGEDKSGISSKLRNVNSRLKEEGGHVPHTELVLKSVTPQEKEDALCGHAEKLALAYGLLNTPDGTTLLVTKNLRMCNDCHSSTKIMSSLEKRRIIVRDAQRVHQFVNGCCSCKDRH